MAIAPNPPLKFRCTKCGLKRSIDSDAITLPSECPKCGSEKIAIVRKKSIINVIKELF